MTQGDTKKIKIKVKKVGGEIVKVSDENNNPATPVTQTEIDQIYQNQGFKHVGVILYAESSPGCYYFVFGGSLYMICHP
jgi:hypothetical protein